MNLRILGSGGGEGYPALFCSCDHCEAARRARGKSLRSLSQSLINGKLLIDMPADTYSHFIRDGIDFGAIEHVLITHTHFDHYCPNILDTRGTDFAPRMKTDKLNIYGNADVKRVFDSVFSIYPIREEIRADIIFHELNPYVKRMVGDFEIIPLKANHMIGKECAFNYIVDDGKSALLFLLDSGEPLAETWEFITRYARKFDCVVMDGTMGEKGRYSQHMNFEQNIALRDRLEKIGSTHDGTAYIVTHITHNHAGLHEEVEKFFRGSGIIPAYDGMTLNF